MSQEMSLTSSLLNLGLTSALNGKEQGYLKLPTMPKDENNFVIWKLRVEASIRMSLDACRRILLDMGCEIQRLTGEESLSLASRARESLRYTVCTSRKIQENGQSLDTHLQTLRTSLQLLQW